MTVPASTTVSATNAGGGPTSVTVTAGSYTPTTLCSGFASQLNLTRPQLAYPLTAAKTAAYIGYGTWTSGYLCNDTSGNPVAVFGSPTLTASGVTYSNAGARSTLLGDTSDLAIGFDGVADYLDGSTNFDVTTDDLCVAWVGKWSAKPAAYAAMFSKAAASLASGWAVYSDATNIGIAGSTAPASTISDGHHVGSWHVGIAVIDRGATSMRVATMNLSTGEQTISTGTTPQASYTTAANFRVGASAWVNGPECFQCAGFYIGTGASAATGLSANLSTALTNFAQAINAGWTVSLSTGSSGTGQVTIDSTAPLTESEAISISWTSTDLRDILGFTADFATVTAAQTGTAQARGLWLPGCTLAIDSDPKRAPKASDHRATKSPRGAILARVNSSFRRHRNLRYTHVAQSRAWESEASIVNSGFDTFYNETQLGLSSSWFTPSSALVIYYDSAGSDAVLGVDLGTTGPTAGWQIEKPVGLDEVAFSQPGWTGMVQIVLGDVTSPG